MPQSGDHSDDYKNLMKQKRFLNEIEQGIQLANREIIHNRIPEITKESVLSLAIAIAKLRASYLEAAFRLGGSEKIEGNAQPPSPENIKELRTQREMYEEARASFDALRYAIERGYVDVDMKEQK